MGTAGFAVGKVPTGSVYPSWTGGCTCFAFVGGVALGWSSEAVRTLAAAALWAGP